MLFLGIIHRALRYGSNLCQEKILNVKCFTFVLGGCHGNEMMVFRPILCTLFRLNWAKQTPGIMRRN